MSNKMEATFHGKPEGDRTTGQNAINDYLEAHSIVDKLRAKLGEPIPENPRNYFEYNRGYFAGLTEGEEWGKAVARREHRRVDRESTDAEMSRKVLRHYADSSFRIRLKLTWRLIWK